MPEQIDELTRHLDSCEQCAAVVDRQLVRESVQLASLAAQESHVATSLLMEWLRQRRPADAVGATRVQQFQTIVCKADPSCDVPGPAAEPLPDLAEYVVLGRLGRGGMGEVFKARDIRLGRLVAVKMIVASRASSHDLLRFRAEAHALAKLQHPHIVQIFEVNEHEGQPFIVLELLEGGTLAEKLRRQPQPTAVTAGMIETLARTMHAAHLQGIVHRDLKPSNVLLTTHGELKITDFGLAKQLDEDSQLTRTGVLMGTPDYMAPEQAAGTSQAIGPAADVYALGAMLYEMLTGKPPFRAGTMLETLEMVRSTDPVPPSRLRPNVPRDLETICLKCLEKKPDRRYASALELAEDIHRFSIGETITARRAGAMERVTKWARRRPTAAALVATVVVALAALGVLGAWSNNRLRHSAERADARSRQARAVVDDMYTRVAEEWLAEEPYKDALRQEFLEKALALYQEFVEESDRDPELRRQAALASFRMGEILRTLDRGDGARAAYARAIAAQEALRDEHPTTPIYRQDLANTWNWLGELLRERGRPSAEVEPNYREALTLQQQLVKETPNDVSLRKELARSHYNLAIVDLDQARHADAADHLEQAIGLLGELRRADPGAADVRHELARCLINRGVLDKEKRDFAAAQKDYQDAIELLEGLKTAGRYRVSCRTDLAVAQHNIGNLYWEREDVAHALDAFRRAIDMLERLVEEFPDRSAHRKKLADTLNSLASAQATSKDRTGAAVTWGRARDLFRGLTKEFPDVPDYRKYLGITLGNLGWLRTEDKDWSGARPLLEEAIGELTGSLKANPKNPHASQALRRHYRSLAETLIQLGDHAAAVDAALSLSAADAEPQDCYHAACFVARCVPLAEKDDRLGAESRKTTLARYQDQAIAQLARALRDPAVRLERLADDRTIFRCLEKHPQFHELAARLPR
jgi:tetratricopeptide (TPR) repeat protein